jgi:multiple sugar transport system substrate-binding protein
VFICFLFLFNIDENDKNLKGKITVWADESSYEYLNTIAQEIMISNNKCQINVEKISKEEYVSRVKEALSSGGMPNIIKLDNETMNQIIEEIQGKISIRENKDFIDSYSNNFTPRMLQSVTINNGIMAIPFSNKPIVLYLREDLLAKYGYSYENINTWEELINMGKDIYIKSEGKIKVLNGIGKDYEYLVSLLIMQAMEETTDEKLIKEKVNKNLEILRNDNILNLDSNGSFLARISSVEGMQEIRNLNVECTWTASNAPSKSNGSNRFYIGEGENLLIINKDSNNENILVEKYIGAVVTRTKDVQNYINDDSLLLSYLSLYKSKNIEIKVKNFKYKSPLVIMANIMQKAPKLEDNEIYLSIKDELLN